MSLLKLSLILLCSQMKLFLSVFLWDLAQLLISYILCVLAASAELPTKEYIDPPTPVYKSRSVQMVAGLMLGLQQQQSFKSAKQHSSEMYSSHADRLLCPCSQIFKVKLEKSYTSASPGAWLIADCILLVISRHSQSIFTPLVLLQLAH